MLKPSALCWYSGSREMIDTSYGDPSADFYNKPPLHGDEDDYDDDDDTAAGFHKDGNYNQHQGYPQYVNQDPYNPDYQDPGYHPGGQVGYAPPPHVNTGYNPPGPVHRSSPTGHTGAYVQDGQYHLQGEKVADDSSPSLV